MVLMAQTAQEVTLTVTSINLLFEGNITVTAKPVSSNYCTKIPPSHTTTSISFPTASTAYPLPHWSQTRTSSRPCQGTQFSRYPTRSFLTPCRECHQTTSFSEPVPQKPTSTPQGLFKSRTRLWSDPARLPCRRTGLPKKSPALISTPSSSSVPLIISKTATVFQQISFGASANISFLWDLAGPSSPSCSPYSTL